MQQKRLIETVAGAEVRVVGLDRSQRDLTGDPALFGMNGDLAAGGLGVRGGGECCDRGVVKHHTWSHGEAGLAGTGHRMDEQDRVAAQVAEVVVDADPPNP